MFRVLFSYLFASLSCRNSVENALEFFSRRDWKQGAGRLVTTDSLCVSFGSVGRYLHFDPPLEVRIRTNPDRMAFDSLTNSMGETAVLYEVEVLTPKRLPEGAGECFLDGPSYGPSCVTPPRWWEQLSPSCLETRGDDETATESQ